MAGTALTGLLPSAPQDPPNDGNNHFTQSSTPTNVNLVTAAAANGAALPPSKLLVAHGVLMGVAYALGMPAAAFAARWGQPGNAWGTHVV